jgi:hypothetical protein
MAAFSSYLLNMGPKAATPSTPMLSPGPAATLLATPTPAAPTSSTVLSTPTPKQDKLRQPATLLSGKATAVPTLAKFKSGGY